MEKIKLVELINQMTLEEKIDQLLQLAAEFYSEKAEDRTGPMEDLNVTKENIKSAGSILGVSGAAEAIRIQNKYMQENRLGIPTLFMADIIHGYRTIFPIPLAIGCTWDVEAAKLMAEISANEAAVSGLHVTFSPMVDLVRDPRWGRVMESTGEDAYLNSCFAEAFVKGYQGENLLDDFSRVAACVKHFAAYGAAIAGRDYNTVNMSERQLRETYLPSYKAALDAGVKLVMTSFNTIDGIPASGNRWLLRDVLRDEFGFNGVVISDWGAVKELIPHGVANDEEEAAELSIKAGVDIEMMTTCYAHTLKKLIREGTVEEKKLDEAVLRILELKNDLGLFEHPHRGANELLEKEMIFSGKHRNSSKEIASKSIVLLKNDGILPFTRDDKVALVGPGVNSKDILGAWSWQGKQTEAISLLEGSQNINGNIIVGTEDFDYFNPTDSAINEAVELGKTADKVVLALGETEWMSGEAASRSDIKLPKSQIELFEKIYSINPNIVVTLYNGRPLDLSDIDMSKAIVEAWFPGTEGGNALAEILWGIKNPSGKLSMSFPESVGQIPVYYNCDATGRPYENAPDEKYVSKYLDVSNYAKYPFGYGLSYSSFSISDLKVERETMTINDSNRVSVMLENLSDVSGEETVQMYIRDLVAEVVRPIKELKGFKKVKLNPHEQKEIEFKIDNELLEYCHSNQSVRSDKGDFEVMIGTNSRDLISCYFRLI